MGRGEVGRGEMGINHRLNKHLGWRRMTSFEKYAHCTTMVTHEHNWGGSCSRAKDNVPKWPPPKKTPPPKKNPSQI